MAPLADVLVNSIDTNAAMVISVVLTLGIGVSLIVAVIACGCCGKKEAPPAGTDIFFSPIRMRPIFVPNAQRKFFKIFLLEFFLIPIFLFQGSNCG